LPRLFIADMSRSSRFLLRTFAALFCFLAATETDTSLHSPLRANEPSVDEPSVDEPAVLPSADELTRQIDKSLLRRWDADSISPAAPCPDETFVRRVYLDLAGRIPTVDKRQAFMNDDDPNKRSALVDTLIVGEDHIQHLADTFDTLLMGRGDRRRYRERVEYQWRDWLERVFRENRPWNHVVAEILRARPEKAEDQGAVWFLYERNDNYQAIAEAVAPAFFGIRIDCAQCHDHMIASEIEQRHYWGLVAFFNRGKNEKTDVGPRVVESAIGGFSEFADLSGSSSPNVLTFYDADAIDEPRPDKDTKEEDSDDLYLAAARQGEPRVPKFSRREKFVQEVVDKHPMVARAMVNRVWAMLLGRGIVHPFDQMDSVHEPSHPELLDWLAEDFRTSDYDTRRLIRGIANSRAYQLDSRRPDGVDDPATFAWYLERPLTAEQLARSMQLGLKSRYENQHPLVGSIREKLPEVMPETVITGIGESLFLSNNPAVNQFISDSNSETDLLPRLADGQSVSAATDSLFITLLGRLPDPDERGEVERFLKAGASSDEQPQTVPIERLRLAAWTLITSAEFRFNH